MPAEGDKTKLLQRAAGAFECDMLLSAGLHDEQTSEPRFLGLAHLIGRSFYT